MKGNKRNKWLLPFGSMLVAAAIAAGAWFAVGSMTSGADPSARTVVSLSMNAYSTLDGLTGAADTVVAGTVKNLTASVVSGGKEGDGGRYPYDIYEFEVQETLKGDASGTIYIVRTAPSFLTNAAGFSEYPLTVLSAGETVILYLRDIATDLLPEVSVIGTLHVPISLDNGVFDVTTTGPVGAVGNIDDNAEIRPRGIGHSMFARNSVFTASDIREAIAPASGEEGPVGPVGSTN